MIYFFPTLYKDQLLGPDSDMRFIYKGKLKDDTRVRWQPVKKILPFIYVNKNIGSEFIDYKGNFEKENA